VFLVSVDIQRQEAAATQPVAVADLHAYFHDAAKSPEEFRVGAEFEKFVVAPHTGRALSYDEPGGVGAILTRLANQFDWQPQFNEAGDPTGLFRDGATVSLEPGGQVELATAPAVHLGEIAAQFRNHLDELRTVSDPDRVALVAAGVTPLCPVEQIALMPRVRHGIMARYLPERSPTALHMMKATASTQCTFDFADEEDAARKFTPALKLGPIVNALWGNAPLYDGGRTGHVSHRGHIWRQMDPDRSGLLTDLLADHFTFERWAAYLLDVPMMFTYIDGCYRPSRRRTFRDFLQDGEDGYFPTLSDWEVHLTTVFPEVRLKKFLEVRGADAVAGPLALSVPALWKGLLYDDTSLDAATELANRVRPVDLVEVFESAYRIGLSAEYQGRRLSAWCRELVDLAAVGLRRQAEWGRYADERRYLDPAYAVLERGRSPGAEYLAHGPTTDAAAVVRWFAYAA
jgi:glutamate--cysteine ligase